MKLARTRERCPGYRAVPCSALSPVIALVVCSLSAKIAGVGAIDVDCGSRRAARCADLGFSGRNGDGVPAAHRWSCPAHTAWASPQSATRSAVAAYARMRRPRFSVPYTGTSVSCRNVRVCLHCDVRSTTSALTTTRLQPLSSSTVDALWSSCRSSNHFPRCGPIASDGARRRLEAAISPRWRPTPSAEYLALWRMFVPRDAFLQTLARRSERTVRRSKTRRFCRSRSGSARVSSVPEVTVR